MKAVAVFPAERRVAVVDDQPEPAIATPTQVKMRMLEVGVCGTDKEICHFDYGQPPEGHQRLVLGHESLAEVVEVGEGVKSVKVGDLVVPTVRRPCGQPECKACAVGRQDYCYTGLFKERGINGLDGYMTELVVEEEKYLHMVPADLRDIAALTEPLTISQKALKQIFDVQDRLPWKTPTPMQGAAMQSHKAELHALVLGAGPVGILAAMSLLDAGFRVSVYSRSGGSADRVDIVEKIGARFVVAEEVSTDQLPSTLGPIDAVIEAVGASQLAFDVLKVLGPNAIFVFTGVPGRKGKVEVDTDSIMRDLVLKNQALVGTVNAGPDDFRSAIASLRVFRQSWPGQVERLKTGRFSPEEAVELLVGGGAQGIKNVVEFG